MFPVDQHYTPPWLAKRLAEFIIPPPQNGRVGDLSAGDGELLRACVASLESSVQVVARDLDSDAISRLTIAHPDWDVGISDVFSTGRGLPDEIDPVHLLVLNPPFSYRGAGGIRVDLPGFQGRLSPAMAFLVLSLQVLREDGQCLAILPASTLTSLKDSQALSRLEEDWGVGVIDRVPPRGFPGVSASVVLVELGGRSRDSTAGSTVDGLAGCAPSHGIRLEVVRGCTPVHRVSSASGRPVDFLHSTGLRGGVATPSRRSWDSFSGRVVSGPFIAIPRVGQFAPTKVCVFNSERPVLLSDCVIALRPDASEDIHRVHSALLEHHASLEALYAGSCAPYVTIVRLVRYLESLGFGAYVALK